MRYSFKNLDARRETVRYLDAQFEQQIESIKTHTNKHDHLSSCGKKSHKDSLIATSANAISIAC